MAQNLYEFYKSKGQALPSIQNRQATAKQAGISNYTGTSQQNNQLLSFLQNTQGAVNNLPKIDASTLGQPSNINIPTPGPTTNPDSVVAGLTLNPVQTIDVTKSGAYNQATQQLQQQEGGINAAQRRILELQGTLGQEATRKGELQQELGVSAKEDTLAKLNQEALASQKRYLAEQIATAGRPTGLETQGGKLDQLRRRQAIDVLTSSINIDVASGDLASAQRKVDDALKLEFDPIRSQIDTTKQFLEFNMDNFNRAEKQQAKALDIKLDREKQYTNFMYSIKKSAYDQIIQKGGTPEQIKTLQESNSPEAILKAFGSTAIQNAVPQLPDGQTDVVGQLTNIIKYSGETVPSASNAIGVLAGVQKAVQNSPNASQGIFKGAAPIRFFPGVFGGDERRAERIINRSDFGAIQGAVQKWMTGANVGDDQRKFVQGMVPEKGDTDFKIRQKLNNLSNYMQTQAQAELAARGIDFIPTTIDYFAKPADKPQEYYGYTLPGIDGSVPTYQGYSLPN